ncbi:MAG: hypothetical protein ABI220_00380 [Candidatus Saccharimonadales bacterium]
MDWIVLIVLAVVAVFGGVLLFGAPYLPTLSKQAETALDLLDLRPHQTLLELGSGDGKVLVVAARRGLNVVGIELNPLLVIVSWLRTRRYHKQVRVIWGNFWRVDWPKVDGVYVFLLDRFMGRLDSRLNRLKPIKLVSFAFQIPGRKPKIQKDGLFLYDYK